jgi:hypothetical protein
MLCGAWSGQKEWGSEGGNGEKLRRELQDRLVSHILRYYHLELKPWKGEGYLVGGPASPAQHVRDLSGLWAAVERATGDKCDPLAPGLIESLRSLER